MTVNSASNDLTVISGFEGSDPVVSVLPSGGVDPTTAFDFTADGGFDDLVVGNGDGALALFEGGTDGLDLVSVEEEPDLPDPTALSFASLTGGAVNFYAATAGRESAELVSLSLTIADLTGSGGVDSGGEGPTAPPIVPLTVQLVGLNNSSLPVLATVLTPTLGTSSEETGASPVESEGIGVLATVGPGISSGQGPLSLTRGGGSASATPEEADGAGAVEPPAPAALAPWERYALRLDQALEALVQRVSGELVAPAEPVDGPEPPTQGNTPEQGDGSALQAFPERPAGVDAGDGGASLPGRRTGATDGAIPGIQGSWQPVSDGEIRAEAIERLEEPSRRESDGPTMTQAIDAGVARLDGDRASDELGSGEPPLHRRGEAGLLLPTACLALGLVQGLTLGSRRREGRTRSLRGSAFIDRMRRETTPGSIP